MGESQSFTNERSTDTTSYEKFPKDETCATVDTGCQRMAIGVQTLRQLVGHLPDELGVQLHQQEHRFRSAHGRSSTNHVASVPTSLGFKGSLLKPAGFENDESKHAPFLISPPFLLFCMACVVLGPPKRFEDPFQEIQIFRRMPPGSHWCTPHATVSVFHRNRSRIFKSGQEFEILKTEPDRLLQRKPGSDCPSSGNSSNPDSD